MKHRVLSKLTVTTTIAAITALLTTPAAAHLGHGLDSDSVGLLHFLLQPSHGGVALAAVIVLIAASIAIKRRRHG
ncbi:MAG TPA: hypothetical protein VFO62_12220 [Candidatus Binatia bacterium]|nr:hypothetical protein [Candidatus Binatia bacterium]